MRAGPANLTLRALLVLHSPQNTLPYQEDANNCTRVQDGQGK